MKSKIFLVSILFLAALLRLYKLSSIPPGVNRDEASIGYTAYSLIKTGNDEYGRRMPFSFQSFGDWKLPLYIYTTIPFVKTLGMNELAVRLPSAIAGIITVLIVFFLVQELFQSSRLALFASFLLAISPWHLHFSRVESESNVAVLFTALAFFLFLKGLKKHLLLPLSAIFFALPYYTYHGNHITSTLFLVGLLGLYWKKIPKDRHSLVSLIVLILLPAFIIFQTLNSADKTKISGISIFGDPAVIYNSIEVPRSQLAKTQPLIARAIYNRITYAVSTITLNYVKSFSPEFLFIHGGTNHAHNIENFGNLYLAEAPFFYLGIFILFLKRKNLNYSFLFWWLLISPIAGSITKDAPHSNRMFAIYPLPPILTALGIIWIFDRIRKSVWLQKGFVALLVVSFTVNFLVYLHRYFIEFPKNEARYWGYGYKKLADVMNQPQLRNRHVIMSHPEYSPYIYLLFYSKFDPLAYQRTAVRYPPTPDAFVHVKSFDRFEFRKINWETDVLTPQSVIIEYSEFLPDSVKTSRAYKEEIFLPNGKSFLTLIET